MAGKKITDEQLAGNTEVLNDLLGKPSAHQSHQSQEFQNQTKATESEKNVHLTMLVKESTRKHWKQFFIEHDLNTTQGIEIAMMHLINDVESKKYRLSKGGLSKITDEFE